MSLQSVTSIHEVWILDPVVEKASNMDVIHRYKMVGRFNARVCALDAKVIVDLRQRGMEVSHKIYASTDPGSIREGTRLQWGRTIMDVVGPVRDVNGLGRLWIIMADAKSRHNDVKVEVIA